MARARSVGLLVPPEPAARNTPSGRMTREATTKPSSRPRRDTTQAYSANPRIGTATRRRPRVGSRNDAPRPDRLNFRESSGSVHVPDAKQSLVHQEEEGYRRDARENDEPDRDPGRPTH